MLKIAHSKGATFDSFGVHLRKDDEFDYTLYTDASLTIGIGGLASNCTFYQNKWSDIQLSNPEIRDIQWRELCAIFVFVLANIKSFKEKVIHIYTDNDAVKWMMIKCAVS